MSTDTMGERVAILHIGQRKTGSTSIQNALAGYDDGSTFYATFGNIDQDNSHNVLICTAFGRNPLNFWYYKRKNLTTDEILPKKEKYLAQFSAMLKRQDRSRIIISSEDIWKLDNADKKKLVDYIRQHGWQVHVIAYVREPARWAASYLSLRIKSQVVTEIPQKLDPQYRLGLETFARLLPPEHLQVRVFDRKHLACGDVVTDFYRILGLDLSQVESARSNESLSLSAIKLLFFFYRSGLLTLNDADSYHSHRQFVQKIKANSIGQNHLDPTLCEGVAEYSETDWLYETFGIDFRRKTTSGSTKADLEAVLGNLSDVDLSGLDELLSEYGIAGEKFITAEQKLYRLFYTILVEHSARHLFNNPGRNLQKRFYYRVLKHLSKYRILSAAQREGLEQAAIRLRNSWITGANFL